VAALGSSRPIAFVYMQVEALRDHIGDEMHFILDGRQELGLQQYLF
jgi:hypothetical protein